MLHATTIAAISSPPGDGRRGLIRISGPRAKEITESCCRVEGAPLRLDRRGATRARLGDGVGEQPVVVLWMPGPASLTGEDVVEWHVSGAPDLVRAALERALALGAELARPGEFTRRAFENGRTDLARAEGVLALVSARNEGERRAATALLLGGLSRRTQRLRDELADVRALCEASLDFDERDTGGVALPELASRVESVREKLAEALAWEVAREAPSGAPRFVLVGRPNAGKSSLFNRLTDATALVSENAGTTRDALRRPWRLGGLRAELWDTAGVGLAAETGSAVDAEARERARALHRGADAWLWVVDARDGADGLAAAFDALAGGDSPPPTLLVLNKLDALDPRRADELVLDARFAVGARVQACLGASARAGTGLSELALAAGRMIAPGTAAEEIRELSARHRAALAQSSALVAEARQLLAMSAGLDLAADVLRRASDELDPIEGRTTPEDLLDRIFARFCLGK